MSEDKTKAMTNDQLWQLALHTCQWCQAVLRQGKRFIDSVEAKGGTMPWEENDNSSMFLADKTFLITAVNHAIFNLERFNFEMMQLGDNSFVSVLDAIATKEERQQIKDWRNMNEHDIDYMTGCGRKQGAFISHVNKGTHQVETNAFITYINGNIDLFLIGDIEIDRLLMRFKDNLPAVKEKTKEIFDRAFLKQ